MNPKIKMFDNKVFITDTKEVSLGDHENVEELKRALRLELSQIKNKVKTLKLRAEEIQETLKVLRGDNR